MVAISKILYNPTPLLLLFIDPQLVFAKTHTQSLDLQKENEKKTSLLTSCFLGSGSVKRKQVAAPSSSTNLFVLVWI